MTFVDEIGFAKVHIFPYSKRKGTKAATMDGQLTNQVKKEREHKLLQVELKNRKAFMESFIGKTQDVLVEKCSEGICNGFTKNYLQVKFKGEALLCNKIVKVKITGADENNLYAALD